MRYKKRYILAYISSNSSISNPSNYKSIINQIRQAYNNIFGRDDLNNARISLVHSKSNNDEKANLTYNLTTTNNIIIPIIIKCGLEHYKHVMQVLRALNIQTLTTSGTLKALRKKQGLLIARKDEDGDEVRAAPG